MPFDGEVARMLPALRLPELLFLPHDFPCLVEEIHEHRNLRAQYGRDDGFEQEVDRAEGVALENTGLFRAVCGHEYDRRMGALWPLTNETCRLKPIHSGHAN